MSLMSPSLWHVVVDTDATASKLLDVMLKEKTGRVTFMPLNRLKSKPITFPNTDDAVPLIQKLRYDPILAKAFEQVFGKTCVCNDLTLAASYVRSHGVNTITIDGDKVDRKGALTGGYYDVKRSRIDAIKHVATWRPKLEELNKKHQEVIDATSRLDQEITVGAGKLQVATNRQKSILQGREGLVKESMYYHREQERLAERAAAFEAQLADLERENAAQQVKKESYEKELGTPMIGAMTAQEIARTDELSREIDQRKKSLAALVKRRNEVRDSVRRLATLSNEFVRLRRPNARTPWNSTFTRISSASAKSCVESSRHSTPPPSHRILLLETSNPDSAS